MSDAVNGCAAEGAREGGAEPWRVSVIGQEPLMELGKHRVGFFARKVMEFSCRTLFQI